MNNEKTLKEDALYYHAKGRPGKIEVIPSKEYANQRDLSLAYSPGVAEPCLAIQANPEDAYKYTAKGNLVAVISNGSTWPWRHRCHGWKTCDGRKGAFV
jgi:malate dehydrogenase (oxaloacetate-decarboxylating)(NADP+)